MSKLVNRQDHIPVLLNEALDVINPKDGNIYVDATFGAGGYTRAILSKANCNVIGIDCDQQTKNYALPIKTEFLNKFSFFNDNFSNVDNILQKLNITHINGIVFDLGVSSMQLEKADRGFSFIRDGPLDMRMDNNLCTTAAELVNKLHEKQLADLIYQYGEERKSRSIARNIVHFRQKEKITTTMQLVKAIEGKKSNYKGKIHFATRTFQAFRIAVNNELENLKITLKKLPTLLSHGGTVCVISFHSLEDKIVKEFFKKVSLDNSNFERVNKKIILPSYKEVKRNPRARSAKLRGLRRIK